MARSYYVRTTTVEPKGYSQCEYPYARGIPSREPLRQGSAALVRRQLISTQKIMSRPAEFRRTIPAPPSRTSPSSREISFIMS